MIQEALLNILNRILGGTIGEIPRVYQAYLNKRGDCIKVLTRAGGGNREECWFRYQYEENAAQYESDNEVIVSEQQLPTITTTLEKAEAKNKVSSPIYDGPGCDCCGCFMKYHVSNLPGYMRDYDCNFDDTYAVVVFRVPLAFRNATIRAAVALYALRELNPSVDAIKANNILTEANAVIEQLTVDVSEIIRTCRQGLQ